MLSRRAQIALGVATGLLASPLIYSMALPKLRERPSEFDFVLMGGLVCAAISFVCIVPYGRPYTIRLVAAVAAIWGGYSVANAIAHFANKGGAIDLRAMVYGPALAAVAGYYAITGRIPDIVLNFFIPKPPSPSQRAPTEFYQPTTKRRR